MVTSSGAFDTSSAKVNVATLGDATGITWREMPGVASDNATPASADNGPAAKDDLFQD